MKVVLINPPRLNEIRGDNPCFIDEERGQNPPLGLLYIAAYLEKYTNFPVEIIDAQAEALNYDERFKKRIPKDDDLIAGMTAMTLAMLDVLKTARLLRQVEKESSIRMKIVLGGPHPTIYPRETINLADVDYVVVGEGELAFCQLCRKLSEDQEPFGVKGVFFKNGNQIISNEAAAPLEDVDSLPFPARHLTDFKKYYSIISRGKKIVTTMITSRGCPFKCAFCTRPHLDRHYRARSAKNVVEEMQECLRMGIEEIFIYDDTFTVNRMRVMDICSEIVERRLWFTWDMRTRVDMVDEAMLEKLKQAGCARIHFGVESGTERILKILNKNISVKQAQEVFHICHKLKIETLAYFMIGSPSETREDILETIDLAIRLRPEYVHATIFTLYAATAIYNKALVEGAIKCDYWREFARNPQKGIVAPYWHENFSRQELFELLEYFYRRFYGRPSYIFINLFRLRSVGELKRKAKAGLKVLGLLKSEGHSNKRGF